MMLHSNPSYHYRTCPSTLSQCRAKTIDLPGNVYKKFVAQSSGPPEYHPVLVPRNKKQVHNCQQKERQKCRLTHDAIYNLHEVVCDLDGFVRSIKTYPDLEIICGLPSLSSQMNQILATDSTENPQLLFYDTTFQLGDFMFQHFSFDTFSFQHHPSFQLFF